MDHYTFEKRIQKFNKNFKIRVTEKEVGEDEETKSSSGIILLGKKTVPVFEVWDIDRYGQPYVAISFEREELNEKNVAFVKTGDLIRKKGLQLELYRKRKELNDKRIEDSKKERRRELDGMASDFQPIIRDLANEQGVTKGKAIESICKSKGLSWEEAKKEYVRLQGEAK